VRNEKKQEDSEGDERYEKGDDHETHHRRIGIRAIARIGRAQKGCKMLAMDSPIATAMVVAAKEA